MELLDPVDYFMKLVETHLFNAEGEVKLNRASPVRREPSPGANPLDNDFERYKN